MNAITASSPLPSLLRAIVGAGLLMAAGACPAATVTVASLADNTSSDGICTLREALLATATDAAGNGDCSAGSGNDEIAFQSSLFAGSPPQARIDLDAALGPLVVYGASLPANLMLRPPPGSTLEISGGEATRLIDVQMNGADLTLADVVLRDGSHAQEAGAMRIGSVRTLRLERVAFLDNATDGWGGGAIHFAPSTGSASRLEFQDCLFERNRAENGFGGALHIEARRDVQLDVLDSRFSSNSAFGSGGALSVSAGQAGISLLVGVEGSIFAANTAKVGGALHLSQGMSDVQLLVDLLDTRLSDNGATGPGGAIRLAGAPDALVPARIRLDRTSLLANHANTGTSSLTYGGGLWVENADATVHNSLFAGNQTQSGGAAFVGWFHDAQREFEVDLAGNTFHFNHSSDTDGGATLAIHPPATTPGVRIRMAGNITLASPALGSAISDCALVPASGLVLDANHNVADRADCAPGTGSATASPALVPMPLPGPVHTLALPLPADSGLLDLWPVTNCVDADGVALEHDLRGLPRPRNGDPWTAIGCDPGAFEHGTQRLLEALVSGTGSGRIGSIPAGLDCTDACAAIFPEGAVVTLTASADPGSVFVGWDDGCNGANCVLTMSQNHVVEAIFEVAPTQTLHIDNVGDGLGTVTSIPSGISCGSQCSASFAAGSTVTLHADPDAGSAFAGFVGAGCSASPCSVVLNDDATVEAQFAATAFFVEVSLTGSGDGLVVSVPGGIECPADCMELFPRDAPVELLALPATGTAFVGWSGACNGIGDCILPMHEPTSVTAHFEVVRVLSVSVVGQGVVASTPAGVDCPGSCQAAFPQGSMVTLVPTPASGWRFDQWQGDCVGDIAVCALQMNAPHSSTVVFVPAEPQLFSDGFE